MSDNYSFGYPEQCQKCLAFSKSPITLRVAPHFKQGSGLRVMLIGQDPTIFKKPERVREVLMLDEANSQLSRWLRQIFGVEHYRTLTLYATNLVKCSFSNPPSVEGGLKFLEPYFQECQDYLGEELRNFTPQCVLTLGEPAHQMFLTILDNKDEIPDSMQSAFTGQFVKARFSGFEFDYSPCLHIKTFRVAEVYGVSVQQFKQGISSYFDTNNEIARNNGEG